MRAPARAVTRITTRVGRVGWRSETKPPSEPAWPQYGQAVAAPGAVGPSRATGASQRGQASVPWPSTTAVGLRIEPLAVEEVVLDELRERVEAQALVVD